MGMQKQGIKMAVVISSSKIKAPSISDLTILNSDFKCICCQHLQQELLCYWNLKTAKKITELLQEETNSTATSTTANTQDRNASYDSSALNSDLEKNTSGTWRKVNYQTEIQPAARCTTMTTIINNCESFHTTR